MTKEQGARVASMLGLEEPLPSAWDAGVSRSEFEERMQRMEQNVAWLEQQLVDARAETAAAIDQVFCMATESSLDSQRALRQIGGDHRPQIVR